MKKVIFTVIEQKIRTFHETASTIYVDIDDRELAIARHELPEEPVTKAVIAEYVLHKYLIFE